MGARTKTVSNLGRNSQLAKGKRLLVGMGWRKPQTDKSKIINKNKETQNSEKFQTLFSASPYLI